MNKLIATVLLPIFTISGFAQDFEVYKVDDIDPYKDYDSYAFLSDKKGEDDNIIMEKTSVVAPQNSDYMLLEYTKTGWEEDFPEENEIIRNAIEYEFDVEGLDKDKKNPDLLIQYHIYNRDFDQKDSYIHGIDDYQYKYPFKKNLISNLEDGTVIMSIVDVENQKSIWEGYAFVSYDENESYDNRQQALRQAVNALIDKFAYDIN